MKALLLLFVVFTVSSRAQRPAAATWVATWSTANAHGGLKEIDNQTLRQIVHISVGGKEVRLRLSNTFGHSRLRLEQIHISLAAKGSDVVAKSDRVATFNGESYITIASGAVAMSDPISIALPDGADVAISFHVPGHLVAETTHPKAWQTSYLSEQGDHSAEVHWEHASTLDSWYFLAGVDVLRSAPTPLIVAFGDSLTNSTYSTPNENRRWPDVLAQRLREKGMATSVVNEGLGGNRLLRDGDSAGRSALERFARDVEDQPGVSTVIVLIGINDIGAPGPFVSNSERVTADEMILGMRQLITRAHARGIKAIGGTLLPFEDEVPYFSSANDVLRQKVNAWIRTSGEWDAVIDFDMALRDPKHPSRLLPAYDSGDHLHGSDAGYAAMAAAIDLQLLR